MVLHSAISETVSTMLALVPDVHQEKNSQEQRVWLPKSPEESTQQL